MPCASGSAELAELEACGSNARTQLPSIPTQFFTQTPLDTENSCALLVPASQSGCFLAEGEAVGNLRVRRGDQGHSMLESFIALQSEVIRAILSDYSPCRGVPHQANSRGYVHGSYFTEAWRCNIGSDRNSDCRINIVTSCRINIC